MLASKHGTHNQSSRISATPPSGGILDITPQNLCRHVLPGSILEITGAYRSSIASVVRSGWGKMIVRPEHRMPEDGRVLIRVPLEDALLQATAHLSVDSASEPRGTLVVLDAFTNVSCRDRRASVRLTEPIPVLLGGDAEADHSLFALNLGSHGLLLSWPDRPEAVLGERLRMGFRLDGRYIIVQGNVVRVAQSHTAVRFSGLTEDEERYIARCVFRRECAVRRRNRWPGDKPDEWNPER